MADVWGNVSVFGIVLMVFVMSVESNKYSKQLNTKEKIKDIKQPFRMMKINLVWQKALKQLSPNQQEELFIDLKLQDKLELDLKRVVIEGLDEDGEKQAEARQKLSEILMRYGLQDHFGEKDENETFLDRKEEVKDSHMMKMDKKVAKLWKKAKMSGFSDDELNQLKKEFLHHQQRMDEYQSLKNEIDAFDSYADNTLDGYKKMDFDMKDRKQMGSDLKSKHRTLKHDYERLEQLVRNPSEAYDFTEQSVIDLWLLAKKANFSAEELDSLKIELAHFEHKIKKHDHYNEQVRFSKESLTASGKTNHLPVKHAQLEEKANDYGYKVKKHHREIKRRITKAMGIHTEL